MLRSSCFNSVQEHPIKERNDQESGRRNAICKLRNSSSFSFFFSRLTTFNIW